MIKAAIITSICLFFGLFVFAPALYASSIYDERDKEPTKTIRSSGGGKNFEVREFKLSDGTKCVALMNHENVSVSCAWDIRVGVK